MKLDARLVPTPIPSVLLQEKFAAAHLCEPEAAGVAAHVPPTSLQRPRDRSHCHPPATPPRSCGRSLCSIPLYGVHTGLGSSLVARVLHYPPPPTRTAL
jgi:hypothetical protein